MVISFSDYQYPSIMNKLYLPLILALLLGFAFPVKAQLTPTPIWPKAPSGKYVCYTDEMERYRLHTTGNSLNHDIPFENWMSGQLNANNNSESPFRTNTIIYTIPVIFHIIHNGEPKGTGRNIDSAFINAQIKQINNDFRKISGTSGYNTHPFGADVQIQFCAATLSPTNTALNEPGIERINRISRGWSAPPHLDTYVQTTIKPNTFWNPDLYLNIWVCDLTDASGLTLGYAQFPQYPGMIGQDEDTATLASTDGVVLHYSVVGSSTKKVPGSYPYDEGRILTHELGHFFGLRHIWGEGDCTHDDYVFDTPRQNDAAFGCPGTTTNTCDDTQYGSPGDSVDMVKNYMQLTDNSCVNIFTTGQKNRMRVIMGETGVEIPRRSSLRFSDRCQSKPLVSFVVTDTAVNEKTACNFPWGIALPVRISRKPAGTTNITITRTGNTDGMDFTISPDSISFSPTDTADKYFALIMNPDAVFEGHEKANLFLSISDTFATPAPDPYELIIYNDDYQPFLGKRLPATLFYEDFTIPSGGWLRHDYIKGKNRWVIGGSNGDVSSGGSAYISKDSNSLTYSDTSVSHTILYHEINASMFDSLNLSLYYKCKGQKTSGIPKDFGKIMYSLDSLNFFQIPGTDILVDSSNVTNVNVQLPYFLWHQKFYLGFYWENDTATANNPPFAIDDIIITGKTNIVADIQSATDTTAGFDEKPLGPFETVDFYDKLTGDVLATIQDLGGYNWGCVKVEVDRAGFGAQWLTGDPQTTARTKLFDKTYKVTPANNNATGNYKITFYLKQNEVNGWMAASTWPGFAPAKMFKYNGAINNMTYTSTYEQVPMIKAAYMGGANYSVTSTFFTGFSGFGFGNIPPVILPVKLISFSGKEKSDMAELGWKVTDEINMKHYLLQRSNDGINYTTIGTVAANGNALITNYSFIDNNPANGLNFYRLEMFGKDGTASYSNTVTLQFHKAILFSISPNPFSDKIFISYPAGIKQKATIRLFDATGKVIYEKLTLLNGSPEEINTAQLPSGFYSLQIATSSTTAIQKLIKQ